MTQQIDVEYYDFILVYTSFRRHEYYLNIIKYLSSDLTIGLLKFEPKHKWGKTEEEYVRKSIELGATLIKGDARCHSLLISRFGGQKGSGYFKDILEDLPGYIKYEKLFILTGTLMGGVLLLKEICDFLKAPTILIPSIKYFGLYEQETLDFLKRKPLDIVEVGQPFLKYPVFADFKTDYLVAYPSHVSIVNHFQHYCLVKNITTVLFSLPHHAKIFVKPHNVRDEGNRLSIRLGRKAVMEKLLGGLPMSINRLILKFIYLLDFRYRGYYLFKYLPKKLINYFIAMQNDYVFKRCTNLLEHYPAFGLEHYLRGVSKGLITGLSNAIFVALMHKVPICICDPGLGERPANYKTIIKKFGVDKWNGFSTEGFDLIDDNIRDADLIQFLRNHIEKVK
mgnify:CR=1 FL=1|tara:strand:- start:2454 stop:3635 length:1182 start_codon:yes stop_codon:yes gene_type:complete